MLHPYIIATNNQKVLCLLAKFPDLEFYERELSRRLGISSGSANRALNELFSSGAVRRRQEGKMYFYSIDSSNAAVVELKKLVNLMLAEPLAEDMKKISSRIVLYGSCASGTDSSESDIDLFVVSGKKKEAANIIADFKLPMGYENIHIQAVIKTPVELLQGEATDSSFMEEVERGIVLWERAAGESGF